MKNLLLKTLCDGLPYGLQVFALNKSFDGGIIGTLVGIKDGLIYLKGIVTPFTLEEVRPILRPMDSMTHEEIDYMVGDFLYDGNSLIKTDRINRYMEWLLKNHFDVYGLLPLGLAKKDGEALA